MVQVKFVSTIVLIGFIYMIIVYKPDFDTLFHWCLKFLFFGALMAFAMNGLDKLWKNLRKKVLRKDSCDTTISSSRSRTAQEHHEEMQRIQDSKSRNHYERIQGPRERQKLEEKQKKLYRFSRPFWMTNGHQLGGEGQEGKTARDAARQRRLPETVTSRKESVSQPTKFKLIHAVLLPAEPEEGETGVLRVCLRTPVQTHIRRFRRTDTIQTLTDFMTTCGYHEHLYRLLLFPREPILVDTSASLEEAGITRDVTLYVDERVRPEDEE